MSTDTNDGKWLSETREFSFAELVELSGLASGEVQELVDLGVLAPLRGAAASWVFTDRCLLTVRAAARLRQGFDLEPHGLALALALLERIRDLEVQLDHLGARLPRSFR